MIGETMLRVGGIGSEEDLELVRDALDELDADYEHIRSDPSEDDYPQTAYFSVAGDQENGIERVLGTLSEEHGFDFELM
jgi:hypothetical protein